MKDDDQKFMKRAIELAEKGMSNNAGGPFGCVIVKDGEIISEGYNSVTSTNDPTAHAEVVAIRKACEKLGSFQMEGCTVYTSCEPCPMCLGAIYWARPAKVFYAGSRGDAAAVAFDDQFIYDELNVGIDQRKIPFDQLLRKEAQEVFAKWADKEDRTKY